jgi:hypothetical protein
MGEWKKSRRLPRILLSLSIAAVACLAQSTGAVAQMSELDAFQRAVNTQNKQDAMAFLDGFGSSHLVPDLIELLRPDVAAEVCSSMRGGSTRARSACDKVKKAIATQPAAGTAALPQPAPAQVVAPGTASPEFAVVPKSTAPLAAAPNAQTALVPPVEQEPSAGTPAAKPTPLRSRAEVLRRLATRFEQRPFAVDYLNQERGEMVVTYEGKPATFVACGDRLGSPAIAEPAAARGHLSNRLNSRMIIRLEGGGDNTTDISVDAIHVVSIGYAGSQAQNIVDVRLDQPARTGDGRYCWSTGEMERIAQLR